MASKGRKSRRVTLDLDEKVYKKMDRIKRVTGISISRQIEIGNTCPPCKSKLEELARQIEGAEKDQEE